MNNFEQYQQIKQLQKQLKEKDEEIEKVKKLVCDKCRNCIQKSGYLDCAFRNFDNEQCGDLEEVISEYIKKSNFYNTKQVCEKIRKFVNKYDIIKDYQSCAGKDMLDKFLDQIEKGEENGNDNI